MQGLPGPHRDSIIFRLGVLNQVRIQLFTRDGLLSFCPQLETGDVLMYRVYNSQSADCCQVPLPAPSLSPLRLEAAHSSFRNPMDQFNNT